MYKQAFLLLALLAVAGCQTYETPTHVAAPPLQYGSSYKPLPGPTYAPAPKTTPSRTYGNDATYYYGPGRWTYVPPTSPPQPPVRTPKVLPPVTGEAAWVPQAPARAWRWIVIHHSDTANGSAATFAHYHRDVRHWTDLGYDFVIDNGNGGANGLVEVGGRWKAQKDGAHAGVLQYNEYGIGICLVGDFNRTHPTAAQLRSLAHLTAYLMAKYHIPADHVIGHRDVKQTDCPGKYLDLPTIRRMAVTYAQSGGAALAAR